MNGVLLLFLSLSLSGSILALILLALKPLIKNRLSQTWQYYIWLVVVLRFLLPFTPQVSVVGEAARYVQNTINAPVVAATDPGVAGKDYIIPQAPDDTAPEMPQTDGAERPASVSSVRWRDILDYAWLFWLGVATILFVHKLASYRSFARFVKVGARQVTDARILDIYGEVLAEEKTKGRLPLYLNEQVSSPLLVGILWPMVVIPPLEASDDELRGIFRHELTHFRRLDFLYKWLVQITLCLHWFNPLVYVIGKQINQCCELSCDEAVIKRLAEEDRVTYGDALIISLEAQGSYSDFVVSITMSENANLVKERLDMIMSYKKKSRLILCTTVLLTILLLCGFTFTGAYAAASNKEDKLNDYEPYLKYGISVSSDGALYFDSQRIRLLVDLRTDNSFELFYYDKSGNIDLEAIRDHSNRLYEIVQMSVEKSADFLTEMGDIDQRSSISNQSQQPYRLDISELPANLNNWIAECNKSEDIFVTAQNGNYYVYCNSIPDGKGIAWEPTIGERTTIEIFDMNIKGDGYALFCFPVCDTLKVIYKDTTKVIRNPAAPDMTGPVKNIEKKVFHIADGFRYASDHYVLNGNFTLKEDATVHISTNITAAQGDLTFFIQRKGDSNTFVKGYIVDENGVAKQTEYEIKGSNVNETSSVFLKAGDYHTSVQGIGPVRNASWEIVGMITSAPPVGTKNNPDTFDMTDPDEKGATVINLNSNGQKNLIHSSSFQASAGQVLTLEIKSTISGTVDLFLFSPYNQEQRISIGGNNDTKTINLSEGTWAYNCTGFFDSGNVSIVGTVK